MPIIIDGYNLLFRIQERIEPIEESREEVIAFIDSLAAGLHITLLFDSNPEHAQLYPSIKRYANMAVEYSPTGLSADDHILERLRWEKYPAELLIVTSDERLAREVRSLGGKTMSIDAFLQSLTKKNAPSQKKAHRDSPAEFNRLLKIFEAKLDATDDEI